MNLPGRCGVCQMDVVWRGGYWKERRGKDFLIHRCPTPKRLCGAWMPNAKERCARRPEHVTEHRTRYSMDNAAAMRTGRA